MVNEQSLLRSPSMASNRLTTTTTSTPNGSWMSYLEAPLGDYVQALPSPTHPPAPPPSPRSATSTSPPHSIASTPPSPRPSPTAASSTTSLTSETFECSEQCTICLRNLSTTNHNATPLHDGTHHIHARCVVRMMNASDQIE